MKLLISSLFLLGLQGCINAPEIWEGNVYGTNNDILWTDTFIEEDRCIKITEKKAFELQREGAGARSWDCN